MGNRKDLEILIFIALLVSLSVVLGIIDRFLSTSFALTTQGVRIGLANIVILTGLYYLNFKQSLFLVLLKSLLTGLLLGYVTTFIIGFCGSLFSFIIMYTLLTVAKDKMSLVGISVAGSIAHNIGQVFALTLFYTWTIAFQLIWLIPMGIGTGIFVGYFVSVLITYLNKGQVFKTITHTSEEIDIQRLINEDV